MSTHIQTVHAYFPWEQPLRERFRGRLPDRELVIWTQEEEFAAGLPEAEVLFVMRPPRGHWDQARRLRFIQTIGAGVDAVLPAADLPGRVLIANARGLHADHMSEFTIALLLAMTQQLTRVLEQQREHRWRPFVRQTLEGRTLGILGLGAIGEAVARKARALGMRVIGTRRSGAPTPHADRIYPPSGTDEVLEESDAIVVLLPLTPETQGLLDRQRLSRMREGALLVNLARGGIVEEDALAESLKQGHLGGAALDVFDAEPLPPGNPLWDTPNLLITPHMAGLVGDYLDRALEIFFENLDRLERGAPLRNEVDRDRGY